jgi:SPP1 family predicted phage head-tail adaptor
MALIGGIGKYRHRGDIQRATETLDSFRQPIQTWNTLASRWFSFDPEAGQELIDANQLAGQTILAVRLRRYAGLQLKDRILFGTRVLNVVKILNVDELNEQMLLAVKEEVA